MVRGYHHALKIQYYGPLFFQPFKICQGKCKHTQNLNFHHKWNLFLGFNPKAEQFFMKKVKFEN